MRWLGAEQPDPVPEVWLQGPEIPGFILNCWGGGAGGFPDTVGHEVWDVPKLVLAC